MIERIELVAPITALRERDSETKWDILLLAVSVEAWYLQAGSKLSYFCNFDTVIDALHTYICAVKDHSSLLMLTSLSAPVLVATDGRSTPESPLPLPLPNDLL